MKNILLYSLLLLLTFFGSKSAISQLENRLVFNKEPLVKVNKRGPYLGLQRGKYNNLELGYEFQRKAVKLIKPTIYAVNIGFDYNLNENILGFTLGYWQKKGRIDFTYGANLVYKSNFESSRIGFSPVIGYKLSFAHLQIGYNVLFPRDSFTNTNSLYVSLRVVLINNRNYKWRKRKKKE